jgi:FAD/FMN-containing dehydrogenase
MAGRDDSLIGDLAHAVGAEHVLTGPGLLAGYTTDWTRRYHGDALCAVRPASARQVSAAVRACRSHGVRLVPQGGNTGLVGGSVPPPAAASPGHGAAGREGFVVLSTRRLRRLGPVDTLAAQVTAAAGVTIAELRAHATAAGLDYGVNLASRDSATVGGTIATNAGGINTVRYGTTRSQLLGVEAVLADGSVVSHLSGLPADNVGYDLAQLLAGSEGTLAVITAARLRLWPAEPAVTTLLAGVDGIAAAAALYAGIRSVAPGLRAAEYLEAAGVALVRELAGLPAPPGPPAPAYLLAEISGTDEDNERLAPLPGLGHAAVALDPAGRAALWVYRERHTEAIATVGIPHKMDVAVPLARIAEFRAELDEAVRAAAGGAGPPRVFVFGHIGAGNLHVNVVGPDPADGAVDEAVMRLAAAYGGTISAEHGIGRAKAALLHLSRSGPEIAVMRAVKRAFDPDGLLNPGVLLAEPGLSQTRRQRPALAHVLNEFQRSSHDRVARCAGGSGHAAGRPAATGGRDRQSGHRVRSRRHHRVRRRPHRPAVESGRRAHVRLDRGRGGRP